VERSTTVRAYSIVCALRAVQGADAERDACASLAGMWTAATVRHDACVAAGKTHIVGYTEASVGVHLGQAGLLVDLIVGQGKAGAVGVRGAQDMAAMVRLTLGTMPPSVLKADEV
jgi:hypothetical protein